MTAQFLLISKDLKLPTKAVTEKIAFLGRTGSGKTYASLKLAEEMHHAGAQFVFLDPVGVAYGLRLAEDGKGPGLPIPVLGGLRGDIPLEPTGGALIADLIVDRGTSIILDVSQFESDADKARFAQAFADRFFFRKKAAPSAVHVFIEEAQEFVPQNPQREEARMLHAFTRMVKIGRNFGIGVSLISQRPQEVNKKVLNLTELLFCFQLTGPQERKTIEGWIAEKGLDEDIAGELPKLTVGHPHVWSPAWLRISKVIEIAERTTYDASSTPVMGAATATRDLSPIDLDQLRKEMTATIERAKAEDPKELHRRIHQLEHELDAKRAPPPEPREIEIKVPVLEPAQIEQAEAIARTMLDAAEQLKSTSEALISESVALRQDLQAAGRRPVPTARPVARPTVLATYDYAKPTRKTPTRTTAPDDTGLGKCERATLAVLAQYREGCPAKKLTILSGYTWGGTFRNNLATLRSKGLIEGENSGVMKITAAGKATGPYDPLPKGAALHTYWMNHRNFGRGEREILTAVLERYPHGLNADQMCRATGYEWGGTMRNNLARLRTAGVLVGKNSDVMRAAPELFE